MGRVIKFRAYTKNHWINEGMIHDYQDTAYVESCGWNDFPIMQFTGLKDKNGKEIYEGDILKYHNGNIGFVRFDYGWAIEYSKEYSHDMPQYYCDYLEIIGNIYENPDLLAQ